MWAVVSSVCRCNRKGPNETVHMYLVESIKQTITARQIQLVRKERLEVKIKRDLSFILKGFFCMNLYLTTPPCWNSLLLSKHLNSSNDNSQNWTSNLEKYLDYSCTTVNLWFNNRLCKSYALNIYKDILNVYVMHVCMKSWEWTYYSTIFFSFAHFISFILEASV